MSSNPNPPQEENLKKVSQSLNIKFVLGYRADIRQNILFTPVLTNTQLNQNHQEKAQKNRIIYPAGNLLVVQSLQGSQPKIIPCISGTRGITCMTLSPSGRFLAWAEEFDQAIICVYDLKIMKQVKTLSSPECNCRTYVSLQFHQEEGQYLLALSGAPDWRVIYFQWDKNKAICHGDIFKKESQRLDAKLTNVLFHPKDEGHFFVFGTGKFQIKTYKLNEDQPPLFVSSPFTTQSKSTFSNNFLSHCVLKDGYMVVGTDQGEILLFSPQNYEFQMVLPDSPRDGFSIDVIIPYSKGFLVGGQDCTVLYFESNPSDIKSVFRRLPQKIQINQFKCQINALTFTDNEDNLIIGMENGQIIQILFSSSDRVMSLPQETQKFEYTIVPSHSDQITGMDVCVRKQLLGTCSVDHTVKIWNYAEGSLDVSKEFDEEAHALAFHPSGFHIIVAFMDQIRLLNILEHDLVCFKEISAKGCQQVVFSNGGHMFAVTNTNMVQIFQFYTGQNPSNYVFQGVGKVKSMIWDEDDLGIFIGTAEGTVTYFRLQESYFVRQEIFNMASYNISSVVVTKEKLLFNEEKSIYIAGTLAGAEDQDKCIYQDKDDQKDLISDKTGEQKERKLFNASAPNQIETQANISKVCLLNSNKLFLFGTDEKGRPGSLRVMRYPFSTEIHEFQSHYNGISRIKCSFDDNYIFTCGQDGVIIIYTNQDQDSQIRLQDGIGLQPAEEFLTPKSFYDDQANQIQDLKTKISEIIIQQEQTKREQQMMREQQRKELEEQQYKIERENKERYEILEREKNIIEMEYEDQQRRMRDTHQNHKRQTENDFKKKISIEQTRNEDFEQEKKKAFAEFNKQMAEIEFEHERLMKEQQQHYERLLREEKEQYSRLYSEQQKLLKQFNQKRSDLEIEAENQIDQLKEENLAVMTNLFEELERAETQKQAQISQFENGSHQLEEKQSALKSIMEDIQNNYTSLSNSQAESKSHMHEVTERENTIKEKDQRIKMLKKKTQELEKFKFVLDYKIQELKRDIGPKEEEIAKMREQISNMENEIIHFKRTNGGLKLFVSDLKLCLDGMGKEKSMQEQIIIENQEYKLGYQLDVYQCYSAINDYQQLQQEILLIYDQYVMSDQKSKSAKKKFQSVDHQKQFMKERSYLETSVRNLKDKFEKNMKVHEQDNARIMHQNVDLISEINDLKKEKQDLQEEQKRNRMLAERKGNPALDNPEIQFLDQQILEQENIKFSYQARQEQLIRLIEQTRQLQNDRPHARNTLEELDQND